MITFTDMIKEARRALAFRNQASPRWVATRNMTQGQADWQVAVMQEVLRALEKLEMETWPLGGAGCGTWRNDGCTTRERKGCDDGLTHGFLRRRSREPHPQSGTDLAPGANRR